jgi:DNA-directed RNA polymerase subunit N (RpoN/RPB10)
VTTEKGAQEYEKAARESGAKFSSAVKHIKSSHGGVFTEEVFFTKKTDSQGFQFDRWSEAFPTRGLLGTMRSDRTGTEEPYWTTVGPAMERMMEHRGQRARRAITIAFRAAHPELKGFLREHGLKRLWHVPRVFGGIGVPRWESMWSFKATGEGLHLRAALALSTGSRWDSDLAVLSRPYSRALPTTLPLRKVAADMAEQTIRGRWSVIRTSAAVPPGYFAFPEGPQVLLDRITGNVARDLFFLSSFEPMAPKASTKHSGAVARRLEREVRLAQTSVVTTQGGWTCGKAVSLNWQQALRRLQEIENSRVAIYNPGLAPKDWRIDFQTWERILQERSEYEESPRPARAQRAPRRTEILPLYSQILEERRRAAPTTGADRPKGLEAPFREWADRQTKRLVGEAMGWFHGA